MSPALDIKSSPKKATAPRKEAKYLFLREKTYRFVKSGKKIITKTKTEIIEININSWDSCMKKF
jgi:hypothetical protein